MAPPWEPDAFASAMRPSCSIPRPVGNLISDPTMAVGSRPPCLAVVAKSAAVEGSLSLDCIRVRGGLQIEGESRLALLPEY